MNWLRRGRGLAALFVSAVSPVLAQTPDSAQVVERVVAVVGKSVVTQSMLDEEMFSAMAPADRARMSADQMQKLRRSTIDTLVYREALFQASLTDTTVKVTDQEVAERVDGQIKRIRTAYPTAAAMNKDLRDNGYRDLDEYRQKQLEQTRRQMQIGRYLGLLQENRTIQPLNPTEREIREAYDAAVASGQMNMIPPSVTFRQVVIAPKATPEAMAKTRALVDSLIGELRKGADFSTVARRFSMDPGTKERGGDLQWYRRGSGQLIREFEDAAFKLKAGEISEPVQTAYGLHIIQVARFQGNEAHIFHILITPDVDSVAKAAARAKAEQIRAAVAAGASIDSIQLVEHDPIERPGTESPYSIDSLLVLNPAYGPVKTLEPGQVSPVITLTAPGADNVAKYAIIKLTAKYPEGPFPYDAIRDDLRTALASQFGQNAYIKQLLRRTYVDIREQ